MQRLELTLPTAAENVALDEALFDAAEAAVHGLNLLRLWELPSLAVVVGRGSPVESEVQVDACTTWGVPIIRRTTGGAAIVAGPGCLMYSVILCHDQHPGVTGIDIAHRTVLGTLVAALQPLVPSVARRGTSDLALGEQQAKFSGNSLHIKRRHVLYHGTLLYDFPLQWISRLLGLAPRQPEYRLGRDHDQFVANLPVTRDQLRTALITGWQANEPCAEVPLERVAALVAEKYSQPEWNLRR